MWTNKKKFEHKKRNDLSTEFSIIIGMSNINLSLDQMCKAVADRDSKYDGVFVYGVITTGIYCRPTCPSRTARPENLRFFADARAAEISGMRACKRCAPNDPFKDIERFIELARYIEANAHERLSLKVLANRCNLSPAYLQRKFLSVFGVSPKAYQHSIRLTSVKGALKEGDEITGAIFSAGYGSTSRFYTQAVKHIGMTPSAYRAGGAGEVISYACRHTSLGWLMMAATKKGVCFVMFGESAKSLNTQLQAEFPKAELSMSPTSQDQELDVWIDALDLHLSQNGPRPEVPLDLRGTAFQINTWKYLLSIADGDVVSYSDVAEGIGKPKAVRAVASACGKNRIAVLIPCHRVLRADGSLGGYRWSLERKQLLLDAERARRAPR